MRTTSLAVLFFLSVLVGCGDSENPGGGQGGAGGSTGGQSGRGGTGGSATGGSGGSGGTSSTAGSGGASSTAGSGGSGAGTAGTGGSGGATGGSGGATGGTGGGTGGTGGAGGSSGDAGRSEGGSGDGASGEAGGNDTWASFAQGFMVKYCASCHNDDNAGDASRNYRMLAVVMREKVDIACGTAKSAADRTARGCAASTPRARQFPAGNGAKPTDEERDRLLRWIDAGTP